MAAHDGAGNRQSERSLFLAAQASSVFADDEFAAFRRVKLKHPVEKSLKKKRAAMQKALKAYKKTNDYGVAEYRLPCDLPDGGNLPPAQRRPDGLGAAEGAG